MSSHKNRFDHMLQSVGGSGYQRILSVLTPYKPLLDGGHMAQRKHADLRMGRQNVRFIHNGHTQPHRGVQLQRRRRSRPGAMMRYWQLPARNSTCRAASGDCGTSRTTPCIPPVRTSLERKQSWGKRVVIVGGSSPRIAEAMAYANSANEFYAIGDCNGAATCGRATGTPRPRRI